MIIQAKKGSYLHIMGNILASFGNNSVPEDSRIEGLKLWGEKRSNSIILYIATLIYKYNI